MNYNSVKSKEYNSELANPLQNNYKSTQGYVVYEPL
jgi:hypothetical protein